MASTSRGGWGSKGRRPPTPPSAPFGGAVGAVGAHAVSQLEIAVSRKCDTAAIRRELPGRPRIAYRDPRLQPWGTTPTGATARRALCPRVRGHRSPRRQQAPHRGHRPERRPGARTILDAVSDLWCGAAPSDRTTDRPATTPDLVRGATVAVVRGRGRLVADRRPGRDRTMTSPDRRYDGGGRGSRGRRWNGRSSPGAG